MAKDHENALSVPKQVHNQLLWPLSLTKQKFFGTCLYDASYTSDLNFAGKPAPLRMTSTPGRVVLGVYTLASFPLFAGVCGVGWNRVSAGAGASQEIFLNVLTGQR